MKPTIKDKLDLLVQSGQSVVLGDKPVTVSKWKLEGVTAILTVLDNNNKPFELTYDLDEIGILLEALVSTESKYTLDYLRKKLIDQIEGIESGELSSETAKAISSHVQTIVNMTKLELEYRKATAKDLDVRSNKFLEG